MAKTRRTESVNTTTSPRKTDTGFNSKHGSDETDSPQVLILPKNICKDARIITLREPRWSKNSRYLACPTKGLYEFRKISAPQNLERCWFLSPDISIAEAKEDIIDELKIVTKSEGCVIPHANLLIATSIDPLFIILPALAPLSTTTKSSDSPKRLFLMEDEYFGRLSSCSSQFDYVLKMKNLKYLLRKRMAIVCDTVEVGDERMYRLNYDKLFQELMKKAKQMAIKGWPSSMEEKLIKRPLAFPTFYKKCEGSYDELSRKEDGSHSRPSTDLGNVGSENLPPKINADSRTQVALLNADPVIVNSSEKEYQEQTLVPDEVTHLLRLRTSFFFIISNYVAPHIGEILEKVIITSKTTVDFSTLDNHLNHVSKLRKDALETISMNDFSRKRPLADYEESEARTDKRKKENEGKKNPTNCSRGVKALQKANVSGMKKMSDFFKKK